MNAVERHNTGKITTNQKNKPFRWQRNVYSVFPQKLDIFVLASTLVKI